MVLRRESAPAIAARKAFRGEKNKAARAIPLSHRLRLQVFPLRMRLFSRPPCLHLFQLFLLSSLGPQVSQGLPVSQEPRCSPGDLPDTGRAYPNEKPVSTLQVCAAPVGPSLR